MYLLRLLIILSIILITTKNEVNSATLRSNEQFQLPENIDSQESHDLLELLEKEIEHHAGKEKRCSIFKTPNLQSSLELKQKLEQQKRANLCKFCTKLDSRKNLEICKKCFDNPFDRDENVILGNSQGGAAGARSGEDEQQKISNKTNIQFEHKLNKGGNLNINNSTTAQKINDNIVGKNSLHSNITKSDVSTLIKSASASLPTSPHHHRRPLETSKTETIKTLELKENNSIGQSSQPDFARNRMGLDKLEIGNFQEQDTENKRLKRKKQEKKSEEISESNSQLFDISDETLESLDDFVALMEEATTQMPEIPKKKIDNLTALRMRLANLRAKQTKKLVKPATTTVLPTIPTKLEHEILEENINKKLDEILQILSHNNSNNKQSMSKEDMKIKLKNILSQNDDLVTQDSLNVLTIVPTEILETPQEDKKSKLLLKLNIPLNPELKDESQETSNSEEIYDDDLLNLLEPTNEEVPTSTEPTLLQKENKMLSLQRNKLNELRNKIHARRQNLFEKNLNMNPEIDDNKYKNFPPTIIPTLKTLENTNLNLQQLLNEHLNSEERQDIPKMLRFTENKINLPLVLLQNEDGTIEIVLDRAELCSQLNGGKCPHGEKSLCKRKTDDNLTKYPSDIFNILKTPEDKTKHDFYKNIINQKLIELFKSLHINVENSQELHEYIDDMPEKQKTQLKQYILNSLGQKESTTENLHFKIDTTTKKPHFLKDLFRNLLHNQIQKELVNSNVCPSCQKNQCFCKNLDKVFFPPDSTEYADTLSNRILGKRQNNEIVNEDSDNSSDISPHGTVKRRYKIVHNILDWVHDVMVHNNTIAH